ncbi:hypothetical protein AAG570_004972 [Ranatra chinensis]|uniref:Uncharacterized protein n=1 Tax=Ranatra chinensis TaxID=642074 RepID=A0ABD0Y1K7_9HEMI
MKCRRWVASSILFDCLRHPTTVGCPEIADGSHPLDVCILRFFNHLDHHRHMCRHKRLTKASGKEGHQRRSEAGTRTMDGYIWIVISYTDLGQIATAQSTRSIFDPIDEAEMEQQDPFKLVQGKRRRPRKSSLDDSSSDDESAQVRKCNKSDSAAPTNSSRKISTKACPRFMCGGDYNAKHQYFGCRTTNPRGNYLLSCLSSIRIHTLSKPTYWPTSLSKLPDFLGFFIFGQLGQIATAQSTRSIFDPIDEAEMEQQDPFKLVQGKRRRPRKSSLDDSSSDDESAQVRKCNKSDSAAPTNSSRKISTKASLTADKIAEVNDGPTLPQAAQPCTPTENLLVDQLNKMLTRMENQERQDQCRHPSRSRSPSASRQTEARLIDEETGLATRGKSIQVATLTIHIVPGHGPYDHILREFPTVTRPPALMDKVRHSVEHTIETKGQPVAAKPRRLTPDRYNLAREELRRMMEDGICRSSKSAWASSP